MDFISKSVIALFVLAAAPALAQTPPSMILGTVDGSYQLFTPSEVVAAGSSGSNVPDAPASGKFLLESDDRTIKWVTLLQALEEELYAELRTQATGQIVTIKSIDPGEETLTLGALAATVVVKNGLPVLQNNGGKVLTVTSDASNLEWTAKGGGSGAVLSDKLPLNVGTAAAGTGEAASREDHVHGGGGGAPLSDTAPKPVGASNVAGTGTDASRDDHVHAAPFSGVTPSAGTTTGATGSRTTIARSDHAHPLVRPLPTLPGGSSVNFLQATGTATTWVQGEIAPRYTTQNKDDCFRVNQLGTGVSWRDCPEGGGGAALSDNTPTSDGTAAAGTGTEASRDDHVHGLVREVPDPSSVTDNYLLQVESGKATWAEPHVAVLDGLPAITGQGGKVLTVNTTGEAVTWETPSGGGSSGGGGQCEEIYTWDMPAWGPNASQTQKRDADSTAADKILTDLIVTPKYDFLTIVYGGAKLANFNAVLSGQNLADFANGDGTAAGSTLNLFAISSDNFQGADIGEVNLFFSGSDGSGVVQARYRLQANFSGIVSAGKMHFRGCTLGGGGGGGDTPSIPAPSAAGKLKHLRVNAAGAAYELADGPPAAGNVIKGIKSGSNVAGTETTYARTDHEHAIPTSLFGTPVDIGRTNSAGTASTLARSDHVHEGRTVDVFPSIPNDHADHQYLLTPNTAGNDVEWTHDIDDALMQNAADIGAADRRIDDIVMPSFEAPYPGDGYSFSTSGCQFNVDLQKEVCAAKWQRPAMWEYVKLVEHTVDNWSAHDGMFTIDDEAVDIHAALESAVTAYRRFVLNAGWSTTNSGQVTAHYQSFEMAGLPHGNVLGASDNGAFYNVNSNNSLTGSTGYARLEVSHDGDHTVHIGLNTSGATGVRFVLYGVR